MIQVVDATVLVNNEAIPYLPNTLKCTEGLGEQQVRAMSVGGGKTEQVFSRNVESNIGRVMLELPTTPEMIERARAWKTNGNQNVVQIATGRDPEGKEFSRTYNGAALISDYEIEIGSDTTISIEFHTEAPI